MGQHFGSRCTSRFLAHVPLVLLRHVRHLLLSSIPIVRRLSPTCSPSVEAHSFVSQDRCSIHTLAYSYRHRGHTCVICIEHRGRDPHRATPSAPWSPGCVILIVTLLPRALVGSGGSPDWWVIRSWGKSAISHSLDTCLQNAPFKRSDDNASIFEVINQIMISSLFSEMIPPMYRHAPKCDPAGFPPDDCWWKYILFQQNP